MSEPSPSYAELVALVAERAAQLNEQAVLIEALRVELAALRRQAGRDSSNSSQPPSTDGPAAKAKAKATRRPAGQESQEPPPSADMQPGAGKPGRPKRKQGGQRGHRGRSDPVQLSPGRYGVELRDDYRDRTLRRFELDLHAGDRVALDDHASRRPDSMRAVILDQLPPYARTTGTVEFSESLGPLMDDDVAVWLAILGASRIVEPPENFSKIGGLPLFRVEAIEPGASGLALLAGAGEHPVAVQLWPDVHRVPAGQIPGMPGFAQAMLPTPPGPKIVGITVGGRTRSILVQCLPNRATLLVAGGPTDATEVKQFVLPAHHLLGHLEPRVAAALGGGRKPLDWVRYSAQTQRAFAAHDRVPVDGSDLGFWYESLHGKWVDPVIGVVAAYELVRRGDPEHLLPVAIDNLQHFFPQFGDGAYLARVAGLDSSIPVPAALPIVSEGWNGLRGPAADLLADIPMDFASPWVTWADHDATEIGQRLAGPPLYG
ncbi:MAG: DUF6444 domain-containing protein [Pseudonocardia sp.]|nr:DUF6444 domain-containing protein [Pseudonocardia sp.]